MGKTVMLGPALEAFNSKRIRGGYDVWKYECYAGSTTRGRSHYRPLWQSCSDYKHVGLSLYKMNLDRISARSPRPFTVGGQISQIAIDQKLIRMNSCIGLIPRTYNSPIVSGKQWRKAMRGKQWQQRVQMSTPSMLGLGTVRRNAQEQIKLVGTWLTSPGEIRWVWTVQYHPNPYPN